MPKHVFRSLSKTQITSPYFVSLHALTRITASYAFYVTNISEWMFILRLNIYLFPEGRREILNFDRPKTDFVFCPKILWISSTSSVLLRRFSVHVCSFIDVMNKRFSFRKENSLRNIHWTFCWIGRTLSAYYTMICRFYFYYSNRHYHHHHQIIPIIFCNWLKKSRIFSASKKIELL